MMQITKQSFHERQLALIHHYLERLQHLSQMHGQGSQSAQEALHSFDQEWQQLQAQQQRAAELALHDSRAASLVTLFPDTARTLMMQTDASSAIKWIDDALMWADDLKLRYRLLAISHDLHQLRMNKERGREVLDEMYVIAETLNDDYRRAEVTRFNVGYYEAIEDFASQLAWAEQALQLALRLEDQEQIARAYHKLGFAYIRDDQYSRAEFHLKKAGELFQKLGMRLNEGYIFNALASNAYYWGKYDQVIPYGEQALTIVREFGRREAELVIMGNLALFMTGTGNLEKGLHYGQQALAASIEAGALDSEIKTLGVLLLATANLGLAEELYGYVERILAFPGHVSRDAVTVTVEWVLWFIPHEQGDWKTACQYVEKMALAARSSGNTQAEHLAVCSWGNSLIELGELDAAAAAYRRGLELRDEQFENQQARANGLIGMSYIEAQRGCTDDAQHYFDRFFELMLENSLTDFEPPFMVALLAYRAAALLDDSRLPILIEHIEKLFDVYLGHLHDERLRASFLNQYSQRTLMVNLHP